MSVLNEIAIRDYLVSNGYSTPVDLHLLSSVDSTNLYVKALPQQSRIAVCCAEEQTAGRGRFKRRWFSPNAENLYFSGRWVLQTSLATLSALSLAVGLAVLSTLDALEIVHDIGIKWPNDLLWQDKKLGGILIESVLENAGSLMVVIGIGLNVNINPLEPCWDKALDRPWCSLYEICGYRVDRNILTATLLMQVDKHLQQFIKEGFAPFRKQWADSDYLYGKHITVTQGLQITRGTAQGISATGELIIVDNSLQRWFFTSGETSITTED